jgi:hypothetical protein
VLSAVLDFFEFVALVVAVVVQPRRMDSAVERADRRRRGPKWSAATSATGSSVASTHSEQHVPTLRASRFRDEEAEERWSP